MKHALRLFALLALFAALLVPALAQNVAGPNDTTRTHDYARHVGSANAKKLSTGWTHGKGTRTLKTHDYYRHTKTGRVIHVHGYYHSSGGSHHRR